MLKKTEKTNKHQPICFTSSASSCASVIFLLFCFSKDGFLLFLAGIGKGFSLENRINALSRPAIFFSNRIDRKAFS